MLTKRQEKIIKDYYVKGLIDEKNPNYYANYNEMYKKIEKIKDTEILNQDIKRFIWDLEVSF